MDGFVTVLLKATVLDSLWDYVNVLATLVYDIFRHYFEVPVRYPDERLYLRVDDRYASYI